MRRWPFVFASGLTLLAGCTQERVSGDTATYTYAPWVFLLSVVGAAVLTGWGLLIVRQERKFAQRSIGIGMAIGGLLLLLGFAPRTFFTYVTVDETHVEGDDRALWFLADPAKQFNIAFADVISVEEKIVEQIGRKNRDKQLHYLVFHRRSGVDKTVLLTSLLSAARPRVEAALERQTAGGGQPARPAPMPNQAIATEPPPPRVAPAPPRPRPEAAAATQRLAPPPSGTAATAPPPRPTPPTSPPAPRPAAGPSQAQRSGGPRDIPAGREITDQTPLAVGDTVEAYRGEWITAEVTEVMPGPMVKVLLSTGRPSFPIPQPRSRLRLPER